MAPLPFHEPKARSNLGRIVTGVTSPTTMMVALAGTMYLRWNVRTSAVVTARTP